MTHLSPHRLLDLINVLTSWNPLAELGMTDEEQTRLVIDETADEPDSRRFYINVLSDLLGDPDIDIDDREELIGNGTERFVGEPGELSAWLQGQVDQLIAARPVERTTRSDGSKPRLVELNQLWWRLRKLRPEAGQEPSVENGVNQAVAAFGDHSRDFADLLLRFAGSSISDRDKADYVVSAVGSGFFYSDLEAIEWAAALAREIAARIEEAGDGDV